MLELTQKILEEMIFWMAWIIIPLFMEILPAIGGFMILLRKKLVRDKSTSKIARLPEITLIIPVYNSADTLRECIASVYASDYPKELIGIMLVDNESKDNSFSVFCDLQKQYPELSMQWLKARQGKSKALNLALFNSNGKYILHIDSDGTLHPRALHSMVNRFETHPKVHCLTGVILTDPEKIENTEGPILRLIRRCEFYEYGQAFLAGRNYESELNSIYTLSGAFSAFRKSTILKTQLYNTDTVCEDTQVTFQIQRSMDLRVELCEDAFFLVDPIEGLGKLYTQRQRWQSGELEVSHMFLSDSLRTRGFFSDFMIRQLTYDHTFAFPRMIWYFALICLTFFNYPFMLIAGSVLILYALYVFSGFLFYLNIIAYPKEFPELRRYYAKKIYILPFMPIYNFFCFWIRFAAIINSIRRRSGWKTTSFQDEKTAFRKVISGDFRIAGKIIRKLRSIFNS